MKICYFYQDVYPWDVRVEKIMASVVKMGFQGHILSKNNGALPLAEKVGDNLFIHRLYSNPNKLANNIMNVPAFFSPFWILAMLMLVKKIRPELIIIRDLPLAPAAVWVGKLTKCPVLMDMAENYPAMIRDTWNYRGPKLIDYIIRNPLFLKYLEKIVVPKMEGVLVVSQYSAERVKMLGVNPERIWVVSNTPPITPKGNNSNIDNELFNQIRELSSFILIYVGGLEESRGLDVVIKSLPKMIQKIPDALFVIVGKGSSEMNLKSLSIELGIQKHVYFTGWINNKYVASAIKASDVCIVPHYVSEHIHSTIPNKIFDYMLQKKPVLATNAIALEDIIVSNDCGLIYKNGDHDDLASKAIQLKNQEVRDRFGLNGYKAVIDIYNWKNDEKRLSTALNISARKNK